MRYDLGNGRTPCCTFIVILLCKAEGGVCVLMQGGIREPDASSGVGNEMSAAQKRAATAAFTVGEVALLQVLVTRPLHLAPESSRVPGSCTWSRSTVKT